MTLNAIKGKMVLMAKRREIKIDISGLAEKFVPVLLLATIALAFFVGTLWQKVQNLEKGGTTGTTQQTTTNAAAGKQTPDITQDVIKKLFDNKDLISFGGGDKKLLLVEVADPSCPYCHVAAGKDPELNAQIGANFKLVSDGGTYIAPVVEMKKLVDAGKASFVYIYYPGHGNGEMGMKALYCANEKGKFWDVHDLLMTNAGYNLMNNTIKNDKAQSSALANFLKPVFNASDMKSCLDSGKYDSRLSEDMGIAQDLGVNGTPGFFVNTTNFAGAYSYKDMQASVDAALK